MIYTLLIVSLVSMVSIFLVPFEAFSKTTVGKAVLVSGKVLIRNETGKSASNIRMLKTGGEIFAGDVLNTSSAAKAKILFQDKSIVDLGESTLFKVNEYQIKGQSRSVDLSMDYGKVRVSVNKKLRKRGKFKVRTKTATMGVRGTEFLVLSDLANLGIGQESREQTRRRSPQPTGRSAEGGRSSGGGDIQRGKTQIIVIEGEVAVEAKVARKKSSRTSRVQTETKTYNLSKGKRLTMNSEIQPPSDTNLGALNGGEERAIANEAQQPLVEDMKPQELVDVTSEVKVKDETFKQSIEIKVGESQSGEKTFAEFLNDFDSGNLPFNPEDLGFEGTNLGFDPGFNPGIIGGLRQVKVIFTY